MAKGNYDFLYILKVKFFHQSLDIYIYSHSTLPLRRHHLVKNVLQI